MIKNNQILVDGVVILEAYCILRQLERGIDAAMSESWRDFQLYHASKSRVCVDCLISKLDEICSQPQGPVSVVHKTFKNVLVRYLFSHFYRRCLVDTALLLAINQYFKDFAIAITTHPNHKEQGIFREKASELRGIIEMRHSWLRGLKEANSVEHYFRNPSLQSYSIAEILTIHKNAVNRKK